MTTIYFKDSSGRKVAVEVKDEIAAADAEMRRAIWRNEAKERYHRGRTLDTLADDAIEYRQEKPESSLMASSPEDEYIAAEEQAASRADFIAILKTLTPEQVQLVKMLKSGMNVTEIAELRGVSHQAVGDAIKRIQKKFNKFLK